MSQIYAVYKADKLLAMGKSYEVCNKLNIKPHTLFNYCSPTRHVRAATEGKGNFRLGYRIEGDEPCQQH
jgi:hypothetical protein